MLLTLLACGPATIDVDDTEPADTDTDTDTDSDTDTDTEVIVDGGCDPGAAAVYGVEGEELSFEPACLGDGTATSFSITALPDGARFDGTRFTWTPGLADAGHVEVVVSSAGDHPDAGVVDVWVADAWDNPANERVSPRDYTYEYGLPVMHLEVPTSTNDYDDVETTLLYMGKPYAIELKYRGAASAYYPKRSYTLSFSPDDEFEDEDEGFDNRRKVVLTSLFDDNSYLRQLLCYEMWNALAPERHQIQVYLSVLYVNGEYVGLTLVSDHIDGEYWEDWGYYEDASLYKAVDHQANFYDNYGGTPKSWWGAGYEKQEGDPDDWNDLYDLVQFVATSDDATFESLVEDYVVIEEIADWWILVRFTEADDSGGKNAYLYYDPLTMIFHHAPWDFNHALGQTWQTEREASSTDYDFYWSNNLFYRLIESPTYGPVMKARMAEKLQGTLAAAAWTGRVDALLARAEPSAERDWAKWEDSYRSYGGWYWRTDWTTHDEEVAYLKTWITERSGYMNTWFPG
jgi:spore coat protein H